MKAPFNNNPPLQTGDVIFNPENPVNPDSKPMTVARVISNEDEVAQSSVWEVMGTEGEYFLKILIQKQCIQDKWFIETSTVCTSQKFPFCHKNIECILNNSA